MKHLILIVAMLVASARAQQAGPANCLQLQRVKVDHHLLHQQGETVAELTFKARNCYVVAAAEKPDLAFAAEPGLFVLVKDLSFKHEDEQNPGRAKEMFVSVTLSASLTVPVGEHQLRGIIKYQTVNSAGDVTPESLAIAIPFKVAPPKVEHPWRAEFRDGLELFGEVLVGIVVLPIMLIYCPLSGQCPTC